MANLSLIDIHKSFSAVEVIKGISFDIKEGEFVSLVGPSGCGKTTLLRMIAGLEKITSGKIEIDGRTVNEIRPKDRDIAMVFQNYALYPHMNVRENIGFSLRMRKTKPDIISSKVEQTSEILGLRQLLDRFPRELSGGQRQRVAMGRALVRQPKVFLFDEPLSNLDAQLRVQLRVELKELRQKLGITSVYVTHDQIEAMTLSDKIVVLNEGWIAQVGAPLDLYDNPQNVFVAKFIGSPSMNFFEAVIEENNGMPHAKLSSGHLLRLDETRLNGQIGQSIRVGVRPEHFHVSPDADAMKVSLDVVEPTGFVTYLYGKHGNDSLCVVTTERVQDIDAAIGLKVSIENIHIFDAKDGRSLKDQREPFR